MNFEILIRNKSSPCRRCTWGDGHNDHLPVFLNGGSVPEIKKYRSAGTFYK
jgi:hypothetical protein